MSGHVAASQEAATCCTAGHRSVEAPAAVQRRREAGGARRCRTFMPVTPPVTPRSHPEGKQRWRATVGRAGARQAWQRTSARILAPVRALPARLASQAPLASRRPGRPRPFWHQGRRRRSPYAQPQIMLVRMPATSSHVQPPWYSLLRPLPGPVGTNTAMLRLPASRSGLAWGRRAHRGWAGSERVGQKLMCQYRPSGHGGLVLRNQQSGEPALIAVRKQAAQGTAGAAASGVAAADEAAAPPRPSAAERMVQQCGRGRPSSLHTAQRQHVQACRRSSPVPISDTVWQSHGSPAGGGAARLTLQVPRLIESGLVEARRSCGLKERNVCVRQRCTTTLRGAHPDCGGAQCIAVPPHGAAAAQAIRRSSRRCSCRSRKTLQGMKPCRN